MAALLPLPKGESAQAETIRHLSLLRSACVKITRELTSQIFGWGGFGSQAPQLSTHCRHLLLLTHNP